MTATIHKAGRGSRAKRGALALLYIAAAAAPLAGCATRWRPVSDEAPLVLQWPYPPNAAKVTYLRSLTGLARNWSAATVVRSALFGTTETDNDTFVLPVAVARGHDGRLAVADLGRRAVHFYVPGAQSYEKLTGPDDEKLSTPVGVTFDDELRLYVADSGGRVVAFDSDGKVAYVLEQAGPDRLRRPTGIAYSPTKRAIYVVDTLANRVYVFAREGTFLFSFGERGTGPAAFNYPTQIASTAAGEIYVTDALNFRISIFDEDGRPLGTFGRHGDGSGDFAMPRGVAVDDAGVVYVVDGLFDNLQMFSRQGEFLLTVGRRGTGYGEFWLPAGAFIDHRGELYVCDTYNHRVQVFRLSGGSERAQS